jgi:outer membrane receptor protein involved in Fe transport
MQHNVHKNFRSLRAGSWTMSVRFVLMISLVMFSLNTSTPLFAQYDSAAINGTVRDHKGLAISGATVQIENRDTGLLRTTVSNSTGTYNLSQIPPGVYKITASASGFSTSTRAGVTLSVSQAAAFDFALPVAGANETIDVSADAVELQTSSAGLGATLSSETVNDLPLAGRNYTSLLLLQPGVTPINNDQTGGRTNTVGRGVYPSIQGQNNRSNSYLLDGVNNNEAISGSQTITPIPDDIQEMRVLMHNDYAQFGGSVGGVINVITKSGTNKFHGSAWEYWRGSKFFDAKTDPTGVSPDIHQNQFGASIGGPVLLPHYNGRNRTFFYGSYEGFRQTTASSSFQLVPTTAQYSGDFSSLLAGPNPVQIYNPFSTTRAPFVNNQIPANLIDPKLGQYAKTLFPGPTGSYQGGAYNYLNVTPSSHRSDQYDLRGDEYISQKDQAWVHYLHQTSPITSYGGFPGLNSISTYIGHNFGAQWIHTFGANSVLTVGFGQNIGEIDPTTTYNGNVDSIVSAAGFAPSFACGYSHGLRSTCMLPGVGIGSYIGGGENNGSPNVNSDVWEYKADYQKTFGQHTLYTGFNVDTNNQGKATSSGSGLSFSSFTTSNGSTGGDEFASFLLSLPSHASRNDIQNSEHGGYVDGFYAQDQWKIRDNLTLNFGLRYDVTLVPIVSNTKLGGYNDIFDFNTGTDVIQNQPAACSPTQFTPCLPGGVLPVHVVLSSSPGKLYLSDFTNIQPRFGLAYNFNPETVFHASFGRVYDNWAAVEQSAQNTNGWLMQTTAMVDNINNNVPADGPITAENPLASFAGNYPTPTPFKSTTWNSAPQVRNPYSDQWTVGIQQRLVQSAVLTVNYAGSRGRRLDYTPVANTARTPGPGAIAPRTPFPYMQQSFFDQPIGEMDYNSLQTSLQGNTQRYGLTYLLSYTWSKGLDYGADGWYGIGTTSIQNPYDFKADRGVTGYDLPNVFTAGWTWSVPFGKNHFSTGNRAVDYVVGNWKLDGIVTLESGRPFNVYDAGDIANTGNFNYTGGGYERPNVIGNPKPQHQTPTQWINSSAYQTPAQYTFGNSPRNSLRTESFKNLDMSVFREFPFFEATKLQFRLDAFNAFNHPVWGTPNSCQNCINFGVVTSTLSTARQLQLSGKFVF